MLHQLVPGHSAPGLACTTLQKHHPSPPGLTRNRFRYTVHVGNSPWRILAERTRGGPGNDFRAASNFRPRSAWICRRLAFLSGDPAPGGYRDLCSAPWVVCDAINRRPCAGALMATSSGQPGPLRS